MSLIGTSDLRDWIGLPEGDKQPNDRLEGLITVVEDFVDNFCNRKLQAQRYATDPQYCYLDGSSKPTIYVPQYPISYVYEVNVDNDRDFGSSTQIDLADIYFYPSGKIVSEAGYFTKGRRNVYIDYIAGYAPVVGGTHNAQVSSYPLPNDIKQVMVEMVVQTFKEGLTAIHTVDAGEYGDRVTNMLGSNSFWLNVLNKYKAFDMMLFGNEE